MREAEWRKVTEAMNAVSSDPRSLEEIKKVVRGQEAHYCTVIVCDAVKWQAVNWLFFLPNRMII